MDIDLLKEITRFRMELHKIPETGYHEVKTQEYLKGELSRMGYNPQEICTTGVYVYIDAGAAETVAFRSDIDALPMKEETAVPFHLPMKDLCMHVATTAIWLCSWDLQKP